MMLHTSTRDACTCKDGREIGVCGVCIADLYLYAVSELEMKQLRAESRQQLNHVRTTRRQHQTLDCTRSTCHVITQLIISLLSNRRDVQFLL